MLLNDLKYIIEQFWCDRNACSISSLELTKLYGGGKAKFSGIGGAVTNTSDGIIYSHEAYIRGF